ncbi:conserved hypothetical protein [Theileria equi strain WA]|uniref:Uncharacterized protein n=1 Tax=Theileria equi strain WA TaxID=1537102 RepID=L1LDZ4_THEEQ|nr:conserved hypothetical protein [Theileria equi strain WA]EKX73571.1 conserved hypothetical protein [Theileria equi strain WA]|eukprot:XP_004833023.1 conserved hypothetical protein [Theileria equi strain WA]
MAGGKTNKFFSNFGTFSYKRLNLAVFSSLMLVQLSKWSLKRDVKLEHMCADAEKISGNAALKKFDSRGFWAILESKDPEKGDVYAKKLHSKSNATIWESIITYKNEPYLLKRDIINFISPSHDETFDVESSWEIQKTVPTTSGSGNDITPETYRRGKRMILLLLMGSIYSLYYFSSMYFRFKKMLPCISFIKHTCKNAPQISNTVGKGAKIKAIDGKISPNYFDGTVILAGEKDLTIKMVTCRSGDKPFELLKLKIM